MSGSTGTIIYFVALIAVFYFLLIRPQQKQNKERKKMLEAVKVGDSIITNSGIKGKIVKLKEDFFILETGPDRVKLKMVREAIGSVEKVGKEKPEKEEAEIADLDIPDIEIEEPDKIEE